jgi:hypothetical protein
LLLATVLVVATACGTPPPIVGRWENVEEPNSYLEFLNDGRMEMGNGTVSFNGTYELENSDRVKLRVQGVFKDNPDEPGIVSYTYEIKDNVLTITGGGDSDRFNRAD